MQCEKVEIPPEVGTRAGCRTQKVNIKKQRKKYRKEEEYENEKVIFKIHGSRICHDPGTGYEYDGPCINIDSDWNQRQGW